MILFSLFFSYWFQRELSRFTLKINQQVYQDYIQLSSSKITLDDFIHTSKLQEKPHNCSISFYLLFPLSSFIFSNYSLPIQIVCFILIYLSFIDYYYYLTDTYYLGGIFILGLIQLIFYTPENMGEALWGLLFLTLFFIFFLSLSQHFFQKEALGLGDVLLLLALTPFFDLKQMILLILLACLLGIIFTLGYICKYQRKLERLPFIPFITISTFTQFIAKLPIYFL